MTLYMDGPFILFFQNITLEERVKLKNFVKAFQLNKFFFLLKGFAQILQLFNIRTEGKT